MLNLLQSFIEGIVYTTVFLHRHPFLAFFVCVWGGGGSVKKLWELQCWSCHQCPSKSTRLKPEILHREWAWASERRRDVKYVLNKRWRWHVAHQLPGHWRGTNNCRGKSNKRIESLPRAQESIEWDGCGCFRPELQSGAQQRRPLRLEVTLMLSENTFPLVSACLYS